MGDGVEVQSFLPRSMTQWKMPARSPRKNAIAGDERGGFKAVLGGIFPFEFAALRSTACRMPLAVGDVDDSIGDGGIADDGDALGVVGFVGPF